MTAKAQSALSKKTLENPLETEMKYPAEIEERIRARAYELYLQRGEATGHDLDDWLRAEGEVLGKSTAAIAGLTST